MSVVADLDLIRARFLAVFNTTGIQTLFDNAPAKTVDETRPFVRFSILPNDTKRIAFNGSNSLQSTIGLISLQVFTPNNVGSKVAYDIVDQFVGVFRDWRSATADLHCDQESIRAVPNNDGLFQVNVTIPYTSNR